MARITRQATRVGGAASQWGTHTHTLTDVYTFRWSYDYTTSLYSWEHCTDIVIVHSQRSQLRQSFILRFFPPTTCNPPQQQGRTFISRISDLSVWRPQLYSLTVTQGIVSYRIPTSVLLVRCLGLRCRKRTEKGAQGMTGMKGTLTQLNSTQN